MEQPTSEEIIKHLKKGSIVIYPGNEAYEIFCNVKSKESLEKLLNSGIEGVPSLIVNSKQWIIKNLNASKNYIEKLPGPFTFILKVKNSSKLPKSLVTNNVISVRLSDNSLAKFLALEKLTLFSYLLKKKGRFIIDADSIPRKVKKLADFTIDSGKLEIKPHVVIDLTGKIARLVK